MTFSFPILVLLCLFATAQSLTTLLVYDADADNSTIQSCLDILKNAHLTVRPLRVNTVDSIESVRSDMCTRMAESDNLAMILDYSRVEAVNSLLDGLSQQLHVPHLRMGSGVQPEFGGHDFQLQVHPGALLQLLLLKDFLKKERKAGRWQDGVVVLPSRRSDSRNFLTLVQNADQPLVIRKWTAVMEENSRMVEEAMKESKRNFIVDLAPEQLNPFFVLMASKKMLSYSNYFLLTHPEASSADLSTFAYSGANIFAFRPDLGSFAAPMLAKLTGIAKDLAASLKTSSPVNWRPHCSREAWRDGRRTMDTLLTTAEMKFGVIKDHADLTCPSLKHRFHVMQLNTEGYAKTALWRQGVGFADLRRQLRSVSKRATGREIRVTAIESMPFVIYREVDENGKKLEGNDRFTGMSIEIFKKIADNLRKAFIFELVKDQKYGSSVGKPGDSRKTWNGMIGELVNGRADVAVGDLTVTSERTEAVEFSSPYINLGITLLIKKPTQLGTSIDFCAAFKPEVWILVIFCLIITSLVLFVIARLSPAEWYNTNSTTKVNHFTVADSFWFISGAALFRGTDIWPRSLGTRIVGFIWWIFILLLVVAYAITLQDFIPSSDRMKVPVKNMEELSLQTKISYGTVKGGSTYSLFQKAEPSMYKRMYTFMSNSTDSMVGSVKEGVDRVANGDGSYAFILESTGANYYAARDCSLLQLGDVIHPRSFAFAFQKGSSLSGDFSRQLLTLQEKGVLEKIKTYWLDEYGIKTPCSSEEAPKNVPLNAFLLYRLFVGLFVGLILALIVAVVETAVRAIRTEGMGALQEYMVGRFRLIFCTFSGEDKTHKGAAKEGDEEEQAAAEPALKVEVEVNDSEKA